MFMVGNDVGTRGAIGLAFWSRGVVMFAPLGSDGDEVLKHADICK